jgi:hypothetical protein
MDDLSEAALFEWCGEDPVVRFPLAASVVSAFIVSTEDDLVGWAPIAPRLAHSASDPIAVMREFVARFRPRVWSGSRSAVLDANANLLDKFDTRGNLVLAAFIATQKDVLKEEARTELQFETERHKNRDERFE